MLRFIVVCHRRPEWTREQFRRYFRDVHGPLAMAIPSVRRYVQNFAAPDVRRDPGDRGPHPRLRRLKPFGA